MRVTPPPPLLVAQSMASLGRPLALPLLYEFCFFPRFSCVHEISTAASFLASVQFDSGMRFVYSSAPSDRPFSTVGTPPGPPTLPAPVRGSGAGGGGGDGGSRGAHPIEACPHFSQLLFLVVRSVSSLTGGKQVLGCSSFFGAISVDEHLRR